MYSNPIRQLLLGKNSDIRAQKKIKTAYTLNLDCFDFICMLKSTPGRIRTRNLKC